MKKRLLGSLLAALFVVGLMAPAALAGVNGVAGFVGTAEVGERFGADGCPKSGGGTVSGKGLGLPDPLRDPIFEQKNYGYHLATAFTFAGTNNQMQPDTYTGGFEVCGFLTAPLNQKPPLGATCISTKGHNGRGTAGGVGIVNPANSFSLKIYNINWKAAVGGLLTITGNYQVYDANGDKKAKAVGTILAVVNASPSATEDQTQCLTNAQDRFDVVGAAALYQTGIEHPKEEAKKCPEGTQPGQCASGDLKG